MISMDSEYLLGLHYSDVNVRLAAAMALKSINPREFLARIELVWDWDEDVRRIARGSLANMWDDALPMIISRLQAAESHGFEAIAQALGEIGPAAAAAVPALADCLKNGPKAREAAVKLLGQIGPAAANAVPALVECLQEGRSFVHEPIKPWRVTEASAAAAVPPQIESREEREVAIRAELKAHSGWTATIEAAIKALGRSDPRRPPPSQNWSIA